MTHKPECTGLKAITGGKFLFTFKDKTTKKVDNASAAMFYLEQMLVNRQVQPLVRQSMSLTIGSSARFNWFFNQLNPDCPVELLRKAGVPI